MGLESEEWTYWRQTEPHAGDGLNACYGHDHVLIIFDRAAVDGDLPLGAAEDLLRPVVDRHVARCEHAGAAAHGEDAVEVKSVAGDGSGEVGHLANYMADYISVDPDADLVERSVEFIAWAAQTWAANRNKRSRSVSAGDAVDVDWCKQQYRDPDTDQEHDHGERLRHDSGRGPDVVCRECGSGWSIDQVGTITAARRSDGSDGGGQSDGDSAAAELRSRWPSADEAVRVDDEGAVAIGGGSRGWRVTALVVGEGEDAEEHSVGGGGVDMVPLKLPESDDRSLWDPGDGGRFRCSVCNFCTYEADVMKRHAAGHEQPVEETVRHEYPGRGEPPPLKS